MNNSINIKFKLTYIYLKQVKSVMRSKVAQRIQNETPDEVRIFVRQYTDIVLRINKILKANGYTQKTWLKK